MARVLADIAQGGSCSEQLEKGTVDFGYATKFDQGQGVVVLMDGEACWREIIDKVEEADAMISQQLEQLEEQGINGEELGLPSKKTYDEMKAMITDYTDGKLILTSWRWNAGAVTPGNSAGVCVAEPEPSEAYWSCWEFYMEEGGEYQDTPKSYLINPDTFSKESRLNEYDDLSVE